MNDDQDMRDDENLDAPENLTDEDMEEEDLDGEFDEDTTM